jgi:hypothetical protein
MSKDRDEQLRHDTVAGGLTLLSAEVITLHRAVVQLTAVAERLEAAIAHNDAAIAAHSAALARVDITPLIDLNQRMAKSLEILVTPIDAERGSAD